MRRTFRGLVPFHSARRNPNAVFRLLGFTVSHETFPTRTKQLPFHRRQIPVQSLVARQDLLDSCRLLFDAGHEFCNDLRLPENDGMARRQVVGKFDRKGDRHDASLPLRSVRTLRS